MEPLDCCISILGIQELKSDGTRFGALDAHAMSDCSLRVLRHEDAPTTEEGCWHEKGH